MCLLQTVRSFQALNYWGKGSDAMDAYVGDAHTGVIYIDPNTTPLWSPSIPVNSPRDVSAIASFLCHLLLLPSSTGPFPHLQLGRRRGQGRNSDDACIKIACGDSQGGERVRALFHTA